MVTYYYCYRCGKLFQSITHLERHLNIANPCIDEISNKIEGFPAQKYYIKQEYEKQYANGINELNTKIQKYKNMIIGAKKIMENLKNENEKSINKIKNENENLIRQLNDCKKQNKWYADSNNDLRANTKLSITLDKNNTDDAISKSKYNELLANYYKLHDDYNTLSGKIKYCEIDKSDIDTFNQPISPKISNSSDNSKIDNSIVNSKVDNSVKNNNISLLNCDSKPADKGSEFKMNINTVIKTRMYDKNIRAKLTPEIAFKSEEIGKYLVKNILSQGGDNRIYHRVQIKIGEFVYLIKNNHNVFTIDIGQNYLIKNILRSFARIVLGEIVKIYANKGSYETCVRKIIKKYHALNRGDANHKSVKKIISHMDKIITFDIGNINGYVDDYQLFMEELYKIDEKDIIDREDKANLNNNNTNIKNKDKK